MPILPRTLGKPRACFRVRGMLTILLHLGNFQLAELGNFQLARIGEFSTGADTEHARVGPVSAEHPGHVRRTGVLSCNLRLNLYHSTAAGPGVRDARSTRVPPPTLVKPATPPNWRRRL